MTATLIVLTLLCLAALAGAQSARHWPETPRISTLNYQALKIRQARAARCLSPARFRWHPGYRVPAHMREFVIRQRRDRLERVRALPRQCSPVDIGRTMAAARGWTGSQWEDLYELWSHESSWDPCRHYPSTTNCAYTGPNACGIPMFLPCSKLLRGCGATLGRCPVRVQIRRGLNYIEGRYGSPSGALAHSNSAGWY